MKLLLVIPSLSLREQRGLARLSRELIKGLQAKVDDLELIEAHTGDFFTNYFKTVTTVPLKELLNRADIIHAIAPELGAFLFLAKGRRTIVTFHDLIPLRTDLPPEIFRSEFRLPLKMYVNLMWRLAAKADVIICNSTQTAIEVKRVLNRCDSIEIVNPGVDEKFKPMSIKKELLTLGFLSPFSYRKGIDIALEIFRILSKKIDCKLILAGGKVPLYYQNMLNIHKVIKESARIEIYDYIPEDRLVELYNSFDFFLFPSRVEGFGMPILEAQKCGVPTLIMRNALIPQETRRMAIKFNSPEDAAAKILYLMDNKEEYKRISEKGRRYASLFTWQKFVNKHLAIYERLTS